ncbi:hypothetical protein BVC80_8961g36 [Macleaya cordata]|uniref:Uncharacterized protein n=1 Tax=Macleaya cordata TaxID=56857 RepID=A0A200QBD8_MACCD|nr:hypothetical protein BVC80_8961g36 [Macleaya cordata]
MTDRSLILKRRDMARRIATLQEVWRHWVRNPSTFPIVHRAPFSRRLCGMRPGNWIGTVTEVHRKCSEGAEPVVDVVGLTGRVGTPVLSADPSEVEQWAAETAVVPAEPSVEEIVELAEAELRGTVVAVVSVELPASNGLEGDVGLRHAVAYLATGSVDSAVAPLIWMQVRLMGLFGGVKQEPTAGSALFVYCQVFWHQRQME